MTLLRENLLDQIIRVYGFEHPITIMIAECLEHWEQNENNNRRLARLVKDLTENPMIECEE